MSSLGSRRRARRLLGCRPQLRHRQTVQVCSERNDFIAGVKHHAANPALAPSGEVAMNHGCIINHCLAGNGLARLRR